MFNLQYQVVCLGSVRNGIFKFYSVVVQPETIYFFFFLKNNFLAAGCY